MNQALWDLIYAQDGAKATLAELLHFSPSPVHCHQTFAYFVASNLMHAHVGGGKKAKTRGRAGGGGKGSNRNGKKVICTRGPTILVAREARDAPE